MLSRLTRRRCKIVTSRPPRPSDHAQSPRSGTRIPTDQPEQALLNGIGTWPGQHYVNIYDHIRHK